MKGKYLLNLVPGCLLIFCSCKSKFDPAWFVDYYGGHSVELKQIATLYSEISEKQYFLIRVNYSLMNSEVVIKPSYPMPDSSPEIIYGSKESEGDLSRFIIEKAKTTSVKIDSLILLMKRNKCTEMSKLFYSYDRKINNFNAYSVALILREDINGYYGLNFLGFDQKYDSSNFANLVRIDSGVYFYSAKRSVLQ